MHAVCTGCWSELAIGGVRCPSCGTWVDNGLARVERAVVSALSDPNPESRSRTCVALGEKRGAWAIPYLQSVVQHDCEIYVRVAALRALGEIADPSAVPVIEQASTDENLIVRLVARGALEQIRILHSGKALKAGV